MARKRLILEGAALEAVERLAEDAGVSPAELIKRALLREDQAQQIVARRQRASDVVAQREAVSEAKAAQAYRYKGEPPSSEVAHVRARFTERDHRIEIGAGGTGLSAEINPGVRMKALFRRIVRELEDAGQHPKVNERTAPANGRFVGEIEVNVLWPDAFELVARMGEIIEPYSTKSLHRAPRDDESPGTQEESSPVERGGASD